MKKYLLNRLKEPSTFAGLGLLLTVLGMPLNPELLGLLVQVVTGGAGLVAMLGKDGAP